SAQPASTRLPQQPRAPNGTLSSLRIAIRTRCPCTDHSGERGLEARGQMLEARTKVFLPLRVLRRPDALSQRELRKLTAHATCAARRHCRGRRPAEAVEPDPRPAVAAGKWSAVRSGTSMRPNKSCPSGDWRGHARSWLE